MTTLLSRSSNILWSFSSSSSAASTSSESSEESDSCEAQEPQPLHPQQMKLLSVSTQRQNSQSNDQQQQQHQQQQQQKNSQPLSPSQDIEEATPPVSSQRPDPSRRRPTLTGHAAADDALQAPNNEEENNNSNRTAIPPPSRGAGLPLTINQASQHTNKKNLPEPKLIHPVLNKLPLQFRFAFNGVLSNVLFMVMYNHAISVFVNRFSPSTIYSIIYLLYIPLGHLTANLFVFGWPDRYFQSLLSNFPIGLTAIAIGSLLTAYLDQIHFNATIEEYVYENWTFRKMPDQRQEFVSEKSEFYSSLLVLIVTSIWTYFLSVWVNSQPTTSEKKEL